MDERQRSIRLLNKVIYAGHAMGFTSYRVPNLNGSSVQYQSSIYRKIWQTVLLTGLNLYLAFLGFQCQKALHDPKAGAQEHVGLLYITAAYVLFSVDHCIQIFRGREFVNLTNAVRACVNPEIVVPGTTFHEPGESRSPQQLI